MTYLSVFLFIISCMCYFKKREIDVIKVNSWGLSFKGSNEPFISVDESLLKRNNAHYQGEKGANKLYLTFDCGYEAGYTESILNTLKETNVKATFFIVGHYLKTSSNLVLRMIDEGHDVCNHTYHHKDMNNVSIEELEEELLLLEEKFYEVTKSKIVKNYRPPQGVYNIEQLQKANELGYKTIFWSLAYYDYDRNNQYSYQKALDLLKSRTHDGAIILLHNTSSTNKDILKEYINYHQSKGYEFSKLDF